jgi:hypothetical protein
LAILLVSDFEIPSDTNKDTNKNVGMSRDTQGHQQYCQAFIFYIYALISGSSGCLGDTQGILNGGGGGN